MKSLDRNSLDEQTRLVARYVAGDLSRSERAEFEAWLVASPELAAEVEMERRLRRGMASAARRGWLNRRAPAVLRFDSLEVDTGRREARVDGKPVALATREFDLLQFLCENRGLALSRRQLLDGVWGADWVGDDRTVDVHVRQLRKKLGESLPLDTVWGVGYRFG